MNWKKILLITLWALNILLIINIWFFLNRSDLTFSKAGFIIAIGRLFGLLAVNFILMQLLLIGRVKWIEKVFGHDKLVGFHKINGYFGFSFLVIHAFLIITGYSIVDNFSFFTQLASFLTMWQYILSFTAVLMFIIIIGITIFRKKLKYETWYYIHLFIYLAILFAFFHQLNGTDIATNTSFRYYWFALYIFCVGNLLFFRFIRPTYRSISQEFTVEKVVKENHLVTSVYIKGKNLEKLNAKPGQFMILRFLAKGFWWQTHPFSISCAPNKEYLRISVKNVGDFTSLIPTLKKGTRVVIDGPHGMFTREAITSKKTVFIAGGIGITPLNSFLESIRENKDLILLYSNKKKEDFVFKDNIDKISKEYGVKTFYFTTQQKAEGYIEGRIDASHIKKLVPDYKNRDFFVCGPPEMIKGFVTTLKDLGVSHKRIHFEKFAF